MQVRRFMRFMVHAVTPARNGKNLPNLNAQRVRGALMMRGLTFQAIGEQHGVSRQMVWKIVTGRRPGRSGKSAAVRASLEAAIGKERAA
jgi:hypothetical protein